MLSLSQCQRCENWLLLDEYGESQNFIFIGHLKPKYVVNNFYVL